MEIPRWQQKGRPAVRVQAVRLTDDNVDEVANWTQSQIVIEQDPISGDEMEGLNVKTPAGKKRASRGDYVVLVSGSFVVAKPGAFEMKFEPVVVVTSDGPKVESTKREFDDPYKNVRRV